MEQSNCLARPRFPKQQFTCLQPIIKRMVMLFFILIGFSSVYADNGRFLVYRSSYSVKLDKSFVVTSEADQRKTNQDPEVPGYREDDVSFYRDQNIRVEDYPGQMAIRIQSYCEITTGDKIDKGRWRRHTLKRVRLAIGDKDRGDRELELFDIMISNNNVNTKVTNGYLYEVYPLKIEFRNAPEASKEDHSILYSTNKLLHFEYNDAVRARINAEYWTYNWIDLTLTEYYEGHYNPVWGPDRTENYTLHRTFRIAEDIVGNFIVVSEVVIDSREWKKDSQDPNENTHITKITSSGSDGYVQTSSGGGLSGKGKVDDLSDVVNKSFSSSFNKETLSDPSKKGASYGIKAYKDYSRDITRYRVKRSDKMSFYSNITNYYPSTVKYPKNYTATDQGDGTVAISWTIDKSASTDDASDFELQRTTERDFSTEGKNVTLSRSNFSELEFDPEKMEYTIIDIIPERKKGEVTYRYRLRKENTTYEQNGKDISAFSCKVNTNYKEIYSFTATQINNSNVRFNWSFSPGLDPQALNVEIKCSNNIVIKPSESDKTSMEKSISIPSNCEPLTYTLVLIDNQVIFSEKSLNIMFPKSEGEKAKLLSMRASKGYFSDRVTLAWELDPIYNGFNHFEIGRSEIGGNEQFVSIGSVSHTQGLLNYIYEDLTASPGTYYQYQISGYEKCNVEIAVTSTVGNVGFSQPFGTIAGRITYTGNQAVEGVAIRAEGAEMAKNSALYFNGSALDKSHVTIPEEVAKKLLSLSGGTIQFWLRLGNESYYTDGDIINYGSALTVKQKNGKIVVKMGKDECGLSFSSNGYMRGGYNHITISYDSDKTIKIYFNGKLQKEFENAVDLDASSFSGALSIGYNGEFPSKFKGHMDEIRFWDEALDEGVIAQNFGTYLTGKELGLTAYYRCDGKAPNDLFDISKTGNNFNEAHATMHNVTRQSDIGTTPSATQLSLKTYTDADGNYLMNNIPILGDGVRYTFTPVMGIHEFSPSQIPLYFNISASVHNGIDFEDVSSFEVSGKVTYAGGEYPVEGVNLNIDGNTATKNGEIVTTDANGDYTIEVPIGKHYISVSKAGHIYENGGRYPEIAGSLVVFDRPVKFLNFKDLTVAKIAGRVSGGEREKDKPLGYGISKGNLGQATIMMSPVNKKYLLNTSDSVKSVENLNTTIISSTKILTPDSPENPQIEIKTDSNTGEFLALLPPIEYVIMEIYTQDSEGKEVLGKDEFNPSLIMPIMPNINGPISDDMPDTLDLDIFEYHYRVDVNYRVDPQFSVTDPTNKKSVYGDSTYVYVNTATQEDTIIKLYTITEDIVDYAFENPVFIKNKNYTWDVFGFELYSNATTGATDSVPLALKTLDINNSLSSLFVVLEDESAGINNDSLNHSIVSLILDSVGKASYTFTAGFPNLANDHLLVAKIEYDNLGKIITWPNVDGLKGYVFGEIPNSGSNFVTEGPSVVEYILRDPGGAGSYSFLEKGSVIGTSLTVSNTTSVNTLTEASIHSGVDVEVITGMGVATSIKTETEMDMTAGMSTTSSLSGTLGTNITSTTQEHISTDGGPDYVGSMGDVYIGKSTNLIYGVVKKLALYPDDQGIFDIKEEEAISAGISLNTTFNFTQNHITGYLMPDIEKLRNAKIELNSSDSIKENLTDAPLYYSRVAEDHESYGKKGYYKVNYPRYNHYGEIWADEIAGYNSWLEGWEAVIAQNEKAKIMAFKSDPTENFSFDAGVSIERSKTFAIGGTLDMSIGLDLEVATSMSTGLKVNGLGGSANMAATVGTYFNTETGLMTEQTKTVGYVLADDSQGDAFTVDVYEGVDDGFSPIFRTRAGQSACPYEAPDYTQYYEPGAHKLSEGTFQIEKPVIYIDNSKDASAVNIPSGTEATFEIQLSNESEAFLDVRYDLAVESGTNPNGLILEIDGTPLTFPRAYFIEAGTTITKTLKVSQSGLDKLDYDSIVLLFTSSCQNDPSSDMGYIADKAMLSVKYVPSSSPIVLDLPTTLINKGTEDPILSYDVSGYNKLFTNFALIRLQYKDVNDYDWTTVKTYENADSLIDNNNELLPDYNFTFDYNMINVPDGKYDVRAVSIAKVGVEEIEISSEEFQATKDVRAPQVMGNPMPATGVLTSDGDISVVFNEDIRSNFVTDNFISVKGMLNAYALKHSVGTKFTGGDPAATDATFALADRSFAIEAWIQRTPNRAGTFFAHGEDFTLGFTADNRLHIKIGDEEFTSNDMLAEETWQYLAFSYDDELNTFFAAALSDKNTITFFNSQVLAKPYSGIGRLYIGANEDGTNGIQGALHELTLWNRTRVIADYVDRDFAKTGRETGLIGCWPMTAGNGVFVEDKSRGRHLTLPNVNSWYINNINYAIEFDGTNSVQLPAGKISVATDENFAIEFWFQGNAQSNTTLFSSGDGVVDEYLDGKLNIGFNTDGKLELRAQGVAYQLGKGDYLDNSWHHFVLNVVRNGFSVAYVDGVVAKQIVSNSISDLGNDTYTLGATKNGKTIEKYFTGKIDDVRIWNATLSADILRLNRYNRLEGTEKGLVAYYPFEETALNDFNQLETAGSLVGFTLMKPDTARTAIAPVFTKDNVPALQLPRQTEEVSFDFTVSNNKVLIDITEPMYRIEDCILEITLERISDLSANTMSPITWTAYVDMNDLVWSEGHINIVKEYEEKVEVDILISNNSGKEEHWFVENIPSWLSVSKTQGTLRPLSSETIRFTFDKYVNIGSYEANLYLTGNNQIDELFPISLKITGEKPDWEFNPKDYESMMSIVGGLTIEDVSSEDPEDLVGAFIGDECVGIVSPKYFINQNMYYVMMSVYGTPEMNNKAIQLKVWDASTGRIYPKVTTSEVLVFSDGSNIGHLTVPVLLNAEDRVEQLITLDKGWTWLSMNVHTSDMTPDVVFANVKDQVEIVKGKTTMTMPNGANWVGPLTDLGVVEMYKTKVKVNTVLSASGNIVKASETPITISEDWNWIGYTPQVSMPIGTALADLNPTEGDMIKSQYQFAIYSGIDWVGLLEYLEPGRGYLYESKNTMLQTFYYPASYMPNGVKSIKEAVDFHFTPVTAPYSGNMNIVAQVKSGREIVANCEVGVFVGAECRGTEITRDQDMIFLTIAGDEQQVSLKFHVYNKTTGETIIVDQDMVFINNTVHGTLDSPYIINIAADMYTVTFNNSEGEGNMDNQVFVAETPQALRVNTFTRDGYTFEGWSTTPYGEVSLVDSVSYVAVADIILYAVWKEVDAVSVEPIYKEQLSLYPNPVRNNLYVEGCGSNAKRLLIINAIGKIVITQDCLGKETLSIAVGNLVAGIYILEIYSKDGLLQSSKFIKK